MSYVLAGYGITAVVLAGYAAHILRRGRAISRVLGDSGADDGAKGRGWR